MHSCEALDGGAGKALGERQGKLSVADFRKEQKRVVRLFSTACVGNDSNVIDSVNQIPLQNTESIQQLVFDISTDKAVSFATEWIVQANAVQY